MNCSTPKNPESTATNTLKANTKPSSLPTKLSSSPSLVTPIYCRKDVDNSNLFCATTAGSCISNTERPTPPPRAAKAAKALKLTSAAASASQTPMRESVTEDAAAVQVNKLKVIKEGSEENKTFDSTATKIETGGTNLASSNVSAVDCADTLLPDKAISTTTQEELDDQAAAQVQTTTSAELNECIANTSKPSIVPVTVESQRGDADSAETDNRDLAGASATDGLSSKASIFDDTPLSRNNSTGLEKNKLSKTPSFSKISSSLQSSLGALSGNRPDEDTISKSSDTSGELVRGVVQDSTAFDKPKSGSRLSERAKKKSWYNVLYPNYKSRAEDFKKLFKEVPSDERLIVDYSCALQRDILVQGRLYVSQNYVCFHANIFRWETYLTIRWKDVTSITKEKTALVIPNAISICTAKEKYFFATFTTRDKAFLMLFRVWQNTLMNKPMPPQEIWQWVHNCYGDELGLTTDDEDYIDPTSLPVESEGDIDFASALEDTNSIVSSNYSTANSVTQIASNSGGNSSSTSSAGGCKPRTKSSYFFSSNKSVVNSSTTTSTSGSDNKTSDNNGERDSKNTMNAKELTLTSVKLEEETGKSKIANSSANESGSGGGGVSASSRETKSSTLKAVTHEAKRKVNKSTRERDEAASNNQTNLPTDASCSSDSEDNKAPFVATAECTSAHEGRQLVHTILPINVDTLFNMLFSKSKFVADFHAMRKTENMSFGEWVTTDEGKKTRTLGLTVQLLASVGPKVSKVTETQEMRECSKPGELYSIDVNSVNAGIPYADSFSVLIHYCLVRTVDDHTMLSVHAQIKYKKSIWGVVKGFIEKNTWAGMEEYFGAMLQALQNETCIPPSKAKGRRPRRGTSTQVRPITEDVPEAQKKTEPLEVSVATNRRQVPRLTAAVAQQPASDTEPQNKHKWLSVFVICLLCFLIALNVILLLKLWSLEERIDDNISSRARLPNLAALKELPNSNQEWMELLRQQEILHEAELKKWHKVLQTAIELLKKVSVVCEFIHKSDKLTQQIEQIHEEL
ncbi:protein Aster-B-like isoform X3 [Rhagoletis pomonella]|uniref:protein Aster-B-like isoform X3 n=1 Tax=Rhagoletis pomonella TaxID=28610 RepID=UPI00177B4532|nr:protein Aster-B-like isoform X3 [Rhagoletis pomonella]